MRFKVFLILILATIPLSAQKSILENYIREGLSNNLALKQKEFSFNKSIAALDEARGLFFPSLGINARYTRAGGGRTFDIPVGDLVNPIYQGLNSIIGQPLYPTNIPNENILFFREREHDTKVSLLQPLFKPEIYYNYLIKSSLKNLGDADKKTYARQLVKEIKIAYYNYLKQQRLTIYSIQH